MTSTVKERIKTELDQAQSDGKQRVERIGDILKVAASMTFDEIKGGSAELHSTARNSISEVLEELEAAKADPEIAEALSELEGEVQDPDSKSVPTWQNLLRRAIALVQARKGDWFQKFKEQLGKDGAKLDDDMVQQYGDRYLKVKAVLKKAIARLETLKATQPTTADEASRPVQVEILDGDTAEVDALREPSH